MPGIWDYISLLLGTPCSTLLWLYPLPVYISARLGSLLPLSAPCLGGSSKVPSPPPLVVQTLSLRGEFNTASGRKSS